MAPGLTIELPGHEEQTEFNIRRWDEICADSELGRQLARIEGRIETDRLGHIVMSPPPALRHGEFQAKLAVLLKQLLPDGTVITGCPLSTSDGVRVADAAWISRVRLQEIGGRNCLRGAPEICVEVLSPSNTQREMSEKMALYFAAGAEEVWLCSETGGMQFFHVSDAKPASESRLCPAFPGSIQEL